MSFTLQKTIGYKTCKSNFALRHRHIEELPQYQKYKAFVSNKACSSLIVNELCSVDQLCEKIQITSNCAEKYFYLAVNKYFIYSLIAYSSGSGLPYDDALIRFCAELIKDRFELLDHSVAYDDSGQLGNFIHPVTTLFFQRHEQKTN